jgi:hypothetical protein
MGPRHSSAWRPDDTERFTAHPVVKKTHLLPHDPQTSEIIEPQSPSADGGRPLDSAGFSGATARPHNR